LEVTPVTSPVWGANDRLIGRPSNQADQRTQEAKRKPQALPELIKQHTSILSLPYTGTTTATPETRVLITGAAGFIGFHTAKALAAQPRTFVIGLDNFHSALYSAQLKQQ
jgi:hypothetical protein